MAGIDPMTSSSLTPEGRAAGAESTGGARAGQPVDGPATERIIIKPDAGAATEPVPVARASGSPIHNSALPFDPSSEPEEWPAHAAAKGIRVRWPIAVLLVLLVAGGGIWGGAALQRSQNSSSSSSLVSALASRFSSRTGAGNGGSGTTGRSGTSRFSGLGGSAAATAGTVTEVNGNILYVTNASGGLVEVTLNSSTTVTRNAKSTLSALEPGDTVVVDGSKGKNGVVSATTVAATAQGVSGGFGSFGG